MSNSVRHFLPGERVLIREVLNRKVWTVRPVMVIEDSEDQFVSYLSSGTLIDFPVDVEHGEKGFSMWLSGEWELDKKEFYAPGTLRIAPKGKPFEVFATVIAKEGVTSWYVNFQEPLRRQPHGFDTMDETLDLIVSREFTSWHRQDEDELKMAVAMGFYSQEDAERLLDNCSVVEEQLANGLVPWDRSWHDWSPAALDVI
jgi:predicted RNA-binding protein associated with RNAse of E/G family